METEFSLITIFKDLPDPRIERSKRHNLIDVVVIAVVGTLCGADGWEEIEMIAKAKKKWLKRFLELPNGIPSHDTIRRLFMRISPGVFQQKFCEWMAGIAKLNEGEIVAIDGKTLRRSHDKSNGKSAIHMVSAFARENGVVIGQVKVDEKSNEITAIPRLLDVLQVTGCIVTLDAMGCQSKIAEKIIEKQADYVMGLKGNQGKLLEDVTTQLDTTSEESFDTFEFTDGDHSRIEIRKYSVAKASDSLKEITWHADIT